MYATGIGASVNLVSSRFSKLDGVRSRGWWSERVREKEKSQWWEVVLEGCSKETNNAEIEKVLERREVVEFWWWLAFCYLYNRHWNPFSIEEYLEWHLCPLHCTGKKPVFATSFFEEFWMTHIWSFLLPSLYNKRGSCLTHYFGLHLIWDRFFLTNFRQNYSSHWVRWEFLYFVCLMLHISICFYRYAWVPFIISSFLL